MPSIILGERDDETKKETIPLNGPENEAEVLDIMSRVQEMYDTQDRSWREFGDRTLKMYEDDNQKRVNNYVEPRGEDIDDWQTRGFEGITREKMFAFVSKVAMARPKYKFRATDKKGFIDRTVAEIIEDFHDYSWAYEDPVGTEFFFDAWAAAGSGTVIRWEGVEQTREVLEEFESYDVTTGEMKGLVTKEVLSDVNCKSRRVRNCDFLISDWYEPDVQKQAAVCEVQDMSRSRFEATYGKYKGADDVPTLDYLKEQYGDRGFFIRQWESVPVDRVQVFHWYEKTDKGTKYRIIANGKLILATPIPRKDGKYPYSRGIFKPFADSAFFWGKALPDEIASDQDVYNAFKNMVIDRAILHIQRPIVGSNMTEIENETFRPNGIINVKGGTFETMDFAPPGAGDIQMLQELRAAANRQTSDSQQSGQTGKGVTAREIVIADENARKLAGVFRLFLEDFDLRATRLRVGNILQFYLEPTKAEEILGEDGTKELKAVYRTISLDGRTLSDKRNGTKVVEIVGRREDVPTREELDVQEETARLQGFEMEKLAVSSAYVRNFQIDVAIVPESSYEQSRSLMLAMNNEYQMTVAKLYPQKFMQYQDVFFRDLNEAYDKDESEFERAPKAAPQMMPQPQGGPGGPGIGDQLMGSEMNSLARLTGVQV